MNTTYSNYGGWCDSMLRKNLNDESTRTIWNAITSNDFKKNVTPVLKTTTNYYSHIIDWVLISTNSLSLTTVDKLWILSPSEMSIPIIKNYNEINGYANQGDANVHYYDSGFYKNTIKTSNDSKDKNNYWNTHNDYLYAGNTYQWWMLPAGSRKMSNSKQAYHNTDTYSYCSIIANENPSTNNICNNDDNNYERYWLRSSGCGYDYGSNPCKYDSGNFASFNGSLSNYYSKDHENIIVAFSF